MRLDAKQIKQFDEEGWLFLPDCFSARARSRCCGTEAEENHRAGPPADLAREEARRAPRLPPTPIAKRSACSAPIRA